jgi:hypothetical protein
MFDGKTIKRMKKEQLLELIQNAFEDIKKNHESVGEINKISENTKNADIAINKTLEKNGEDGYLKKIEKAASEVDLKFKKIEEAYNLIYEDGENEGEESIKTQLEALVEIFEQEKKELEKFKKEIWGYKRQNESGETEKIDGVFDSINTFHEKQKEKYEHLYKKIETELLSGATAVNLAKVFETKVEEYKSGSKLWSVLFILLLLALTVYYAIVTFDTSKVKVVADVWLHLLFRAPFIIFAMWLAIFFANRRAENKKLEESYKHKEVMARAFTGYKEAIKDLDSEDQELLKIHMNNLLSTMNLDSSEFLETKGENHPLYDLIQRKLPKRKDDN